ncbi:hypothetical protein C2845_PM16G20400 [Panicum miliaceum]|uniref:Uncharacterized protein n=1 Tax=Panicum miliaceum TaxID=4540 RepID=A0A3L6PX35_PANMI|nr:hypothetical protein C2845_PM16G20400 [Panicum miliaceum]
MSSSTSSRSRPTRVEVRPLPSVPVGDETGLPLIQCPLCKRGRVIEWRSQKDNLNYLRVYFKCPWSIENMPLRCMFYRWQRLYLQELVALGVFQFQEGAFIGGGGNEISEAPEEEAAEQSGGKEFRCYD